MSSVITSKGKAAGVETITGTAALYVVGPPRDRSLYGGHVQGVYVKQDSASGGTYRWIHDEQRTAGSGARTAFAAK